MQQAFLSLPVPVRPRRFDQRTLILNLLVALAYAGSGYAGLRIAFVGEVVTLFWPPSGIAFAALWLGGLRLLPGVGVGALAINMIVMHQPQLAALTAVGNMLPPLVGVLVLGSLVRGHSHHSELQRVIWFILVAVLGSTVFSATIGTAVVSLSHQAQTSIQSTWLVWWMGDAMGVLIIAPPILLWRRIVTSDVSWRDVVDAAGFAAGGASIITGLLLIRNPIWAVELCKLFTLLLSLWAGARFGLAGPAAMTLLMSAGAIGVTLDGVGPFKRGDFYDSFALVHSYLFAEAVAGMLLAAALADLRRSLIAEKEARDRVEAASAERIRLLTMISHDVRTPLGGIIGVLQVLRRASLAVEHARLIGLGLRAGATLTTLVNDILDVARVDAGRIVLEIDAFDLHQSLADLVELGRPAADAKGLRLLLTGADAAPACVRGDRARVEQLLGNLINNAINYTPAGGVSVQVAWRPTLQQPLQVEIVDTGPGIDPARVPRMFDAFVLEPGVGKRSSGLGLGLHISRKLAELMEGTVAYSPAPGGGSVFTVTLPLAAIHVEPETTPAPDREKRLRILLVEDDEIAREITCVLLETLGHSVVVAADPAAAIYEAQNDAFDLVLTDIHLGDSSETGLDVARRLRGLPEIGVKTLIVALTADISPTHSAAYRAAGLDGVLAKPLTIDINLSDALAKGAWTHPAA